MNARTAHQSAQHAQSITGRTVSIPGTAFMGRVILVDGPNWSAVAPEGESARLVHHQGYITSYENPVVEIKLTKLGPWGLPLISVDLSDVELGVTLHKAYASYGHATPQDSPRESDAEYLLGD